MGLKGFFIGGSSSPGGGGGGGVPAAQAMTKTEESMIWSVDHSTGASPAAGTVIANQADFDALGSPLKYISEVAEIRPDAVSHSVVVNVSSGVQYSKPGTIAPLGASYFDYSPPLIGANSPGLDFFGAFPSSSPGIHIVGATSAIDSGVAGSIANSGKRSIFTRGAGTWAVSALAGKRIDIISGSSAGTKLLILDNDATTLTCQGTIGTAGACTIDTYQLDSILSVLDAPAGTASFYGINLGSNASGTSRVPTNFIDIQIGTKSEAGFHVISGHGFGFYWADIYGAAQISGDTFFQLFGTRYETGSSSFQGWHFFSDTTNGQFNNSAFFGDKGSRIIDLVGANVTATASGIYALSGFSGVGIRLNDRSILNSAFDGIEVDGDGTMDGIEQNNSTAVWLNSQNSEIRNCPAGAIFTNCFSKIEGFAGSSIDTVYQIESGSDVSFDRSNHTATGTINFANVGGFVVDPSETELASAGDQVVGTDGSRLLAK